MPAPIVDCQSTSTAICSSTAIESSSKVNRTACQLARKGLARDALLESPFLPEFSAFGVDGRGKTHDLLRRTGDTISTKRRNKSILSHSTASRPRNATLWV